MKPSQSGLQPILIGFAFVPQKKLQIFDLHTPLDFEAKDSTLKQATEEEAEEEEEDDDDEEDEEEDREEEGNRAKRRKA